MRLSNCLKIPFEYITEPIKIGEWMHFRPDFWMPAQDCFIIIDQHFLGSDNGRMAALAFTKITGKVLVQLHDCQPGIEYVEGELIFHSGYYVTPEGDYDGSIEWGICAKCQVNNLGHLGTAILCDSEFWSPAEDKCGCLVSADINPLLKQAYKAAKSNFK